MMTYGRSLNAHLGLRAGESDIRRVQVPGSAAAMGSRASVYINCRSRLCVSVYFCRFMLALIVRNIVN